MDTKFENVVNFVEAMYDNPIEYDDRVAKVMWSLEKDAEKHINWEEIMELYNETKSIPFAIAILRCPYVTSQNTDKIIESLDDEVKHFGFLSESISSDTFHNLVDFCSISKMLDLVCEYDREIFSNRSIDLFCTECTERYLTSVNFFPFEFLNKKCKTMEIIQDIVENKDGEYFDEDPPVKFYNTIINNKEIDEMVRDIAFYQGYDPNEIHSVTNRIAKELYASCVETMYDIAPETDKETKAQTTADNLLSKMTVSRQLPVGCQLDFIQRAIGAPDKKYRTLNTIIGSTEYSQILQEAIHIPSADAFKAIKTNDKIITNRVMEEMLKVRSVKELEPTYVSSVLRHTTMSSVAKKFISKHDPNVEIALLMSYHTPKKLCESILKVNNEREKPNKKLNILLKLRDIVFNNTEMPNSQRIMNDAVYYLIDRGQNSPSYEKLMSEITFNRKPYYLFDSEYNALKKGLKELETEFPEYTDEIYNLMDDIENTYKASYLLGQYPQIFRIEGGMTGEKWWSTVAYNDTFFNYIDFNAIYNLNDTEFYYFTEDVKNCNHIPTLSALLDEIKNGLDIVNETGNHNLDRVFKIIHKMSDLYNNLDEKLQKEHYRMMEEAEYDALPFK